MACGGVNGVNGVNGVVASVRGGGGTDADGWNVSQEPPSVKTTEELLAMSRRIALMIRFTCGEGVGCRAGN